MSYNDEERAVAEAAVARLRAEREHTVDDDVLGFGVERDEDLADLGDAVIVDPLDELLAEQEARDVEDFQQFWASRGRKGKTLRNVVPGVDVQLPAALPLAFEVRSRALANDRSVKAVHELFGMLYGAGTLARLIEGGLDGEQLSVLLLWGSANGNGKDMSLSEATAEFERMRAAQAAGKALPPSGTGGTSFGIGASSKQISHGSTRRKGKRKR